MPDFKLKDGFGLNETITPGDGALSKYFQNLPDYLVSTINLVQLGTEDLTNPTVKTIQCGLTFSDAIKIGKPTTELTVGASASGTLSIFVPAKDGAPLFDPDLFGDNIKVAAKQRYVSLSLCASLTGSASASSGDLKFGFNAKSSVTFAYYEQFAAGTTVLAAIKDTIANFCLPANLDDISAMPNGSVVTAEGSGDLKFSGSVNLLSAANPLATANVPALGAIGVSGGGKLTVSADYELSTDYQVRVQKLTSKSFRMGFYRKRNSQFDFSVDASASITAKLGDSDLITSLLQKISADPEVDLKQLEAAGLSEDQSKDIQKAVKSAVNRCLEIGVGIELSRTSESDAMFLYDVDLGALQPEGRTALHSALQGNLTALVNSAAKPPAGVSVVKTLISSTKTFQNSFKLNLLGIYNVLQVSTLMIKGTTAWDASTGELVMTDKISADKIKVITSNLQVKNSDKLRQILAEHFLITAAYRASNNIVTAVPELKGLQSFFDLEKNPGKVRMRDYLMISATLGLQTADAAGKKVPLGVDDFGSTTTYAECGYDDKAFRSLFFDGKGVLYPQETYTGAGRAAIASLVQSGDDDAFRLRMATDDAFFQNLQTIGDTGSALFAEACVNAGVPKDNVLAVGTDYTNVVWFAEAMQTAGTNLKAIDDYLQKHPNAGPNDHDFQKLKQKFAGNLGRVADRATVDFGGPWGFETMAGLGKASAKKWMLVNRYITSALP